MADVAKAYGLVLDEWQENVLEAAMGERADGQWLTPRVGVSVPRQNGKGALIEARELAGLLVFGEQSIVHSAHEQQTARVGFERIKAYFENYDDLRRKVKSVMSALGRESITLTTGQTLRFPARSKGAIRGFSIDCLILDEAQILGEKAWAAILPTMSARPNPQVWLFGTPPTPLDDGEVFERFRSGGVEGKDRRLCWMEWSASPGAAMDDRAAWRAANPALGIRIGYETVQDELVALDASTFARERLGMWDESSGKGGDLDMSRWLSLADPAAERGAPTFGVDVDESRLACIGVGWDREDGGRQVMLTQDEAGRVDVGLPVQAAGDRLVQLTATHGGLVVLGGAAVEALSDRLEQAGVEFEVASGSEFAGACGHVSDGIAGGSLHHGNQPELNESVRAAKWRSVGTAGERAWQLKNASGIGPLAAVTRAVHGLSELTGGGVMSL